MKTLLSLACLANAAFAADIAVLEFKFPGEKAVQTVEITLRENDAPVAVANFKKLADKGFYKGCAFHRAIPGVLVQTGDPLSKKEDRTRVGTGGPGYTLPAEIRAKHVAGAVSAARLPDKINPQRQSNGSQFFVCLSPQPSFDGKYTVFGNVTKGLEILQRVSELPADPNDYPSDRVELRRVKIVSR
jgi:peptidyl-prolyl cis-trans isomerase B (cyclophilin B)